MKHWIILLVCTIVPFVIIAQENLSADTTFFQDQAQVYQRWLKQSGLGDVLKVHTIELDTAGVDTLALYLAFHTDDTDYIINAWEQLKQDFESRSPLTLEQQLFYKMIQLMEIDERQGNVQLYDTYDLSETPCFFVGVQYTDNEVEVVESICKSEIRDVYIPANNLSELKDPIESTIRTVNLDTKREIFDSILRFARQRFKINGQQEENECLVKSALRVREKGQVLRFEADNLCRHVLYDESNSLLGTICERLPICNWSSIKRERLYFIITVDDEASSNTLKLTCEIDGKYSDSWFSNSRGSYKSMEGVFDEYFVLFADIFTVELQEWFQ